MTPLSRYAVTYTLAVDGRRHTVTTDEVGNRFGAFTKAVRDMRNTGAVTGVRVTAQPSIPAVSLVKDSFRQRAMSSAAAYRNTMRQMSQRDAGPVELNPLSWFGKGYPLRSAGSVYAREVIAHNRTVYGGRRQGRPY